MADTQHYVYIVLTQTDSVLSGALKQITHARFNHVSLSLTPDLSQMFSFGRRRPYNPFNGGFVLEAPRKGTFQRFPDTDALVLRRPITERQYRDIRRLFDRMYRAKERYGYDSVGLMLAAFGIRYRRQNKFYCSDFARCVLVQSGVTKATDFPAIVKPIDFLKLSHVDRIYSGKLRDFKN